MLSLNFLLVEACLSHGKTAVLPFTRKLLKKLCLLINRKPLKHVRQHKSLGGVLDRGQTWTLYVEYMEQNINAVINVLRRIVGTKSSLLRVHCAIIRQRIAYRPGPSQSLPHLREPAFRPEVHIYVLEHHLQWQVLW